MEDGWHVCLGQGVFSPFFSLSLTVMAGYRLIEVAAFAVGGGLEVCSGESR